MEQKKQVRSCCYEGNHDGLCFNRKHEGYAELISAAKYARDNVCVGSSPVERNAWQYLNDAIVDFEQA